MKKKVLSIIFIAAVITFAAGLYISGNKSTIDPVSDLLMDNVDALALEDQCYVIPYDEYDCSTGGSSLCPCGSNGW